MSMQETVLCTFYLISKFEKIPRLQRYLIVNVYNSSITMELKKKKKNKQNVVLDLENLECLQML